MRSLIEITIFYAGSIIIHTYMYVFDVHYIMNYARDFHLCIIMRK